MLPADFLGLERGIDCRCRVAESCKGGGKSCFGFRIQRMRGPEDLGPDLQRPRVEITCGRELAAIPLDLRVERKNSRILGRIRRIEAFPDADRAARQLLRARRPAGLHQR
jgi:hypothetical protein